MPRPLTRALRRGARPLTRRGPRATAATAATVAAALLTAGSQAPGPPGPAGRAAASARDDGTSVPGGFVTPDVPLPRVPSQGDGAYQVELPPLKDVQAAEKVWGPGAARPSAQRVRAEAGLPASVFAAYRDAAGSVGRTDPGCGLRWELLAGIGKVESGHAGGGALAPNGDTLTRITGPVLDGDGFALIRDSDGGVWDGDPVYDRAVGPMQFLPGTWRTWGADGNGDGTANPDNVYDAALAAGHYLCAGDRDLGTAAGLERAILSYNYSRDYLNLVLGWMEFYLRGVHTVPDGGGDGGTDGDADGGGSGRPTPGGGATPSPGTPAPSASPAPHSPSPTASPSASPSASTRPTPTPTPTPTPAGTPTGTPTTPTASPTGSAEPSASPTAPEPSPDPSQSPGGSPSPTDSAEPAPDDSAARAAAVTL
jgi:hypothetical protein